LSNINYAIILAAGNGDRMGYHVPKQFVKVAGKTLLEHTIDKFEKHDMIDRIIVVVHPLYNMLVEDMVLKNEYEKICKILNGGRSRKESSFVGINAVENEDDNVLIHDSVRPFVSYEIISKCITALEEYDAVDVAIPSTDTIIKVNSNRCIDSIPNRDCMMRGQTPQGFKCGVIREAHRNSLRDYDSEFTDDCSLILRYGLSEVYVVKGEEQNIKITYPDVVHLSIFTRHNVKPAN